MAAAAEDDVDYESDPEEAKRALTMRRREASDDEEGEGEEIEREGPRRSVDSRDMIESDVESEGQGAAEEYDDNVEEEEEEELVEYVELDEEEKEGERDGEEFGGGGIDEVADEASNRGLRSSQISGVADGKAEVGEEGRKENEPFAVPTAGAFYMHDDRFRENARGRNRRMFDGRRLWETQDDRKWGHDKFEEMTLQERHYNEGSRNSRDRYRGRGRNQGGNRRNPREDRSKVYYTYNQNEAPKITKGRGFKKYDSFKRNKNEAPQMQYRPRSSKVVENPPQATTGRAPSATSDLEPGPGSSMKSALASRLNSASPPFYPSGSSSKETTSIAPTGNVNENVSPSQSKSTGGRNVIDDTGINKLHINDSLSSNAGKLSSGFPMVSSAYPRAQVVRASTPPHYHNMRRGGQSSLQSSIHQSRQSPAGGSQAASSARAPSGLSPFEHGKSESPSEASKFKPKEKGGAQGGGKSPFMYSGSQVMAVSGNTSSGQGDQNFAGAPTFLPVMPFGGQHPGGVGVPAVGMAFPGYVSQPNGLGNSEMTWLPVLAGAAGALGSAYGSPYIALDSAYHPRPPGQTSSSGASGKESNANKANVEWKPSQTPEVTSDEVGQRQKYTRRYTEMKFGQ